MTENTEALPRERICVWCWRQVHGRHWCIRMPTPWPGRDD